MNKKTGCVSFLILMGLLACTQTRVKKYQSLLEPLVGKSQKSAIDKMLGKPVYCTQEARYEKCEYRTAYSANNPVPEMFKKTEALGPDLSPYEYFDVLHLYFDGFHVLKEWEPVVMAQ